MNKETLEEDADIEKIAMDKLKSKWEHLYTFGYPKRPFPTNYENDFNNIKIGLYEGAKIGLYEGAKLMEERMYSEEDMRDYSNYVSAHNQSNKWELPLLPKEWFEKFKNK